MRKWLLIFLGTSLLHAQEPQPDSDVLTFEEYINIVRTNHPLVRSAGLVVGMAEAGITEARGGFDPKLEAATEEKKFGNSTYYQHREGVFRIPTWYGIELQAGFENNDGFLLNPELRVPDDGLAAVGIKVPIGQGLFINQRMADLRSAKINLSLSRADQQLRAAEALHQAAAAYFNWKRQYEEAELYKNFYEVAKIRRDGIVTLIKLGDNPAIDSVEAGITEKARLLSYEEAQLKLIKARLELSNFLWADNVPIELTENAVPEQNVASRVAPVLKTEILDFAVDTHPKITMMQAKADILEVERQLKANSLLPKMDLGYSYLSERWQWNGDPQQNYKVTASFGFPIFLRKERGALRLTKLKLQDARIGIEFEKLQLTNKVDAVRNEISSLTRQRRIASEVVNDNTQMVQAEERLFNLGESSLFLINTRESTLISARLSEIVIENRFLMAHAELFRVLAGN